MFIAIADTRRIDEEPLVALARALRGADGELRYAFDEHEGSVRRFGAAVRNPGFLPEDQFDEQPLYSPNGDTIFVCQVRLDNREELLETLGPWPHRPAELAELQHTFRRLSEMGRSLQ